MTLFLIFCFFVLALGIVFSICGIRAFVQMRKYYKHLTDFDYYDFDMDGDD